MQRKLYAGGLPAVIAAALLLLAACGGTGGEAPATTFATGGGGDEPVVTTGGEETPPETPAQGSEDEPVLPASGSGSATITVGGETWQFDNVLCAFGEQEIGQEGAEFVLSAIDDGLQLYVSIDSYGHSVSLDDIEDFENPSVSLESDWSMSDFIEVSGKQVRATALFLDYNTDDLAGVEGALVAACP